ncbi:hypothetical protein M405DRAFT_817534 [Rhizopogon salebrosus TDB-379]|nr:hypothetical protein M405DRAFT_817534 [Rhizopogon salebrosus TDB-379]
MRSVFCLISYLQFAAAPILFYVSSLERRVWISSASVLLRDPLTLHLRFATGVCFLSLPSCTFRIGPDKITPNSAINVVYLCEGSLHTLQRPITSGIPSFAQPSRRRGGNSFSTLRLHLGTRNDGSFRQEANIDFLL